MASKSWNSQIFLQKWQYISEMLSNLAELARHIPNGVVRIEEFDKKQEIGSGGFGRVFRAVHRKTGVEVAIKELFMDNCLDEAYVRDYAHEIEMLWRCRYPFVLALYGFTMCDPYCIIMPYVCHGSLWDYVKAERPRGRLDGTQKTLIAIGIAYGMSHLHKANIVHRDLKSMNILLDGRMLPFICDFGIARTCEGKNTMMTRECGTPYWMAPEQIESHHYDCKVDVYSYAMILYEMLCEEVPFAGMDAVSVMRCVAHGQRPKLPNKEKGVCSLISVCWSENPKKRPSFSRIYKKLMKGHFIWEGTNPKALQAMKRLIEQSRAERTQEETAHPSAKSK